MFDARELSKSIRMKKKKAIQAEPELVHTDAYPDMEPNDLYDLDKKAQMEETIGSPEQSDARDTMFDNSAQQPAMSKEPMKSEVMPKDHGHLAYGGMPTLNPSEAMEMNPEMEREYVAGSPESNQEMGRRFSNGPSTGTGEGMSGTLGAGLEGEEDRRIKMRKMRLSTLLDSYPYDQA